MSSLQRRQHRHPLPLLLFFFFILTKNRNNSQPKGYLDNNGTRCNRLFFFYYLSYLNVYLKYVFAFSEGRAGLSNMCTDMFWFFFVICFFVLDFWVWLKGLDIVSSITHFHHFFSFRFRSCDLQRNHPPSLLCERRHFSPPYQRTLFSSYFDLAMYLYCL